MPSVSQLVPPFPANLPTASLIVLDFDLLLKKDAQEIEKLYTACHEKGFFYLKNHKVDIAAAFQFGKDLYDIPLAEKEKYAMGDGVNYLGYKRIGEFVVDSKGTPDSQETWNFSKDDAFGFSTNPRPIPPIAEENAPVIRNHISSCQKITSTLLDILSQKLNLTNPALPSLHKFERPAGNQMRLIKLSASDSRPDSLVAGAHTDFGSLTVLFNNVGGLQVLLSPEDGWKRVPPREGCAIINLGDAFVRFTDGLFRSATHRVMQPPGQQRAFDRYSVVYFERPNDDVKLRPLTRDAGTLEDYPTAKEWIERRVLGGKKVHYKDEKAYLAGRGTEAVQE